MIIPARDEAATLAPILARVLAQPEVDEIIVVDDGSRDASAEIVARLASQSDVPIVLCRHARSRGKGAAIRTGLEHATCDLVVIQDADLEYDPADFPALLAPFRRADVLAVYGSRNLRSNPRSTDLFYWGGRLLSAATNLLYGSRLSDESTGYKVVRTALLRRLALGANGFDFCPELTARLLRRGVVIHEVPIRYRPRSFAEGKKIRRRDGFQALWVLLRERLRRTA